MTDVDTETEPVHWLQKLYDNPFLLLAAGLVVMFVFYTGWGAYELLTLPQSKLP